MNTAACLLYFEYTEILHLDSVTHCFAIHPQKSPDVAEWWCTAAFRRDLYTVPGSWKHSSSRMATILTEHVAHGTCMGCSGSAFTTERSSSCQHLPTAIEEEWTNNNTGHNQQPDRAKWWSSNPRANPSFSKYNITYVRDFHTNAWVKLPHRKQQQELTART